ncbi:hypothetical protein LJC46_08740 [Desulfovibrio sp. OttesenSCG-928-G15]|nr:hypothetical protein [Desulfovibrio sp. OttesenSCG-928-G15]
MILALEWIPAWRLKQAYSLTEADILSLVQSLGEQAHISIHPSWGMMEEYFLKPQTEVLPEHWRSTLDDIVATNSPSWIVRAFNERDRLYESLIIIAVHADGVKFSSAVKKLFESVYEGEPAGMPVDKFCAPFIMPNGDESSRLFSQIFHESLLFNKYAAVETLEKAHYPLITEVKGITKDFIKTVHSTTPTVLASVTPHSTGGVESPICHEQARQTGENVKNKIQTGTDDYTVLPQGGSRPETDKIKATIATCKKIAADIQTGLHLNKGKIGRDEFVGLVKDSMLGQGKACVYQKTAAQRFYRDEPTLASFKRKRGEKM